jgi:uncharacterized protein (TIGR04255 family)
MEIRFDSVVPDDAVFGILYQTLMEQFPTVTALPMASIPAAIRRSDPNLAIQALHRLDGEHLTVLVGGQTIAVGIRGPYPGWAAVSQLFKETLSRVGKSGVIQKPRRFGLRYINFFDGDIFPSLTLSISVAGEAVIGEGTYVKTVLEANGYSLLLQVGKDMQLMGSVQKTGSVIDIDSFLSEPPDLGGFDATVSDFLEKAHLAEKQLFFKLLKPEFLKTLNPSYSDAD